MYHTLVLNVDELWLKGKNRPLYFQALRGHVRELLKAVHGKTFSCANEEQRLVAHSESPFREETVQALLKVPGLHAVMPARRVPCQFQQIFPIVKEELEQSGEGALAQTFKVETRRSYKGFPRSSMEVGEEIGRRVIGAFPGLRVDLKNPQLVIRIRILEKNIYISTRRLLGVGGLPVGSSGHVVAMISGGFDSPVASYLLAKRGCRQTFIFFFAYPYVGDEVKDKVTQLVQILGRYQRYSRLYVVPFGEVQNLVANHCLTDYRTLLFRKAMLTCAGMLAQRVKAEALLTGDALGQVSSQTIGNLAVLDGAVPLPIFRPLLGYNKVEILQLAKNIGTHDVSVIPHDDACSLFAPKHPVIKPSGAYLQRFDRELPLDSHLERCLQEAEIYEISLTGEIKKV
jgi:thiamine biosynthesis protein ThiI